MSGLGTFVWYDLATPDMAAADAFYRSVIGWDIKDSGMPGKPYSILSVGQIMVGGVMELSEDMRAMGVPPCWTGYIGVDDVDASAARITKAGGSVKRGAEDIPGVGRFAVVADPHGAAFIIFKPNSDQAPMPVATGATGAVAWRELHAGERESAFAFYAGLFGWTKGVAHDMGGAMGPYQLFSAGAQGGGMMTKMAHTPHPFWLYYFSVDGADAACQRVKQAGGQVLNGPHEVPGDDWIAQCRDPQGAKFAIVSKQK